MRKTYVDPAEPSLDLFERALDALLGRNVAAHRQYLELAIAEFPGSLCKKESKNDGSFRVNSDTFGMIGGDITKLRYHFSPGFFSVLPSQIQDRHLRRATTRNEVNRISTGAP